MTHAQLAVPFLALSLLILAAGVLRQRPGRRWWAATGATLVALLVLTIVFDNVMIAVDLFRYEEAQLSGVLVLKAPIEDLAWPVVAAVALPGLALLLAGSREET